MMTDRITQFVCLMRLLNFFLGVFLTHKLCSEIYFSLQVKNSKHDTCVQGHCLELVVSLIKIQDKFRTVFPYNGNRVSYRNVVLF